jgi:hypothetical protein
LNTLDALEISAAKYFRCILHHYDRSVRGTGTRAEEARKLSALAGVVSSLRRKHDSIRILADAKDSGRSAEVWTAQDDQRLREAMTQLKRHPAAKAAAGPGAGRYVNCPRRDEMFR